MLVPTLLQGAFLFALGACVGSFVNVIAWRWPRRQGIVSPPSRCGTCGRDLQWWENVPILSWCLLRGRCRTCGVQLGAGHLAVELGCAALFAVTFAMLFCGPWSSQPSADASWWIRLGPWQAAPAFASVLVLWGCLLAVALIDAETGYVPLPLTGVATAVGLLGMTLQGLMPVGASGPLAEGWPSGAVAPAWCSAGVGGLAGLVSAGLMLRAGLLPRTFEAADPDDDHWTPSRSRREVLKEVPFLAIASLGMVVGHGLATSGQVSAEGPIWLARILGTLGFGREAMGLGDVHLQAAVGAAFGWKVAVMAFFVAVFIAILWTILSVFLRRFATFFKREIPFGPHLAAAAILFVVARGPVVEAINGFARGVEWSVARLSGGEPVGAAPREDGGKSDRLPPAQLAEPRDRR